MAEVMNNLKLSLPTLTHPTLNIKHVAQSV
jgi:hypothetical protein